MKLAEPPFIRSNSRAPRARALIGKNFLDLDSLVAQIGSEVGESLSQALERVLHLASTGQIDRASLNALRSEIETARSTAKSAQQIARLGVGNLQIATERLDLPRLLREALRWRGRELEERGIEVRHVLAQAQVLGDATLMFSLLSTLLDWSFQHTRSRIDITLDIKPWPAHARLVTAFAFQSPDEELVDAAAPASNAGKLDTVSWRLLQQMATVLRLPLQRSDTRGRTTVDIIFPTTVVPVVDESPSETPESEWLQNDLQNRPLAGRSVLALSAHRSLLSSVSHTLMPLGVAVESAQALEQGTMLYADAAPDAVIYDVALAGPGFEDWRLSLPKSWENTTYICISDSGKAFEVVNAGNRQLAMVGRDAVADSLPAALLFELSRQG